MKSIFLTALILLAPLANAGTYSIVQGSTSDDIAHFTVLAKAHEQLNFNVRNGDATSSEVVSVTANKVSYSGSEWVVHRLRVEGLKGKDQLFLEINRDGQRVDRRQFKTLDLNRENGRVAVGSCMLRHFHNPFLWNNLADPNVRPDIFLLIGDAVYLDRRSLLSKAVPENGLEVWTEFVKARLEENLYFWDHLVPTITIWDDHDSGGDNSDASFKLMPEIRRIYETFFANDTIEGFLEHGPGLAKRFRLFNKNFIMLDGRSYRNAEEQSPLWGARQEQWMLNALNPGANFLVNGTQFFGRYLQKDSLEYNWPNYAVNWVERLGRVAESRGATLAFISGDIHFSEVQDLEPDLFGYPTVEITSSNLHSAGLPGHYVLKPDNPRRREVTGTHNVVLLDFMSSARHQFSFSAWSMGWRGNVLFQTDITVDGPTGLSPLARAESCDSKLIPDQIALE